MFLGTRAAKLSFAGVILIFLLGWSVQAKPVAADTKMPVPASAAFTDCSNVDVPVAECQALVDLYNSTNGSSWTTNTDWLTTDTVCSWYGITCDSGPNVTQVYLNNNNLSGPFAGDFSVFAALEVFYIANDSVTGDISTDVLAKMPTTLSDLGFYYTDLTGSVPSTISTFTNLTSLTLGGNSITGDLGTLIGNLPTSIVSLNLRLNNLTGTIPSSIGSLTNLISLYTGYNTLTGDIGTILGYLPPGIGIFWSENTDFTGIIPSSISGFTNLSQLNLNWNDLDGDLGTLINNLPPSIVYLGLQDNNFTGTVPSSMSNLTKLEWLYLEMNQLTGDLATILGYMPTTIRSINIGYNDLTGTIPESITSLNSLDTLNIEYMSGLSGTIPLSITTMAPFWSLNLSGTYLCEPEDPAYAAWKDQVNYYYPSYCLGAFNGSAVISSSQPVVAIGRPHMGTEIMSYSGVTNGAPTIYLPMLFNNTWGSYTSTFTVQNTGTGTATFEITLTDALTGAVSCVIEDETLGQDEVYTYNLASMPACNPGGALTSGWYGGAKIDSDVAVTAVAHPRIYGTDLVTYNAFTGGASIAYLPMLFRGKWGYQSAFYIQNLDDTLPAYISISFYDSDGNFTCAFPDPSPIQPNATRGYWMANLESGPPPDCDPGGSGTGFDPDGWAGNAVITTSGMGSSSNIVAIARPHMGSEVAAYSGMNNGLTTNYLPMLFRGQWGYNSAIYIQNLSATPSDVQIEFFDTSGAYTCTYQAMGEIGSYATKGYWIPQMHCNIDGDFPVSGWAGSARVITSNNAAVVGRPHLSNDQVVVYNAFTSGNTSGFVPTLFRNQSGNESALYIQNLGSLDAFTEITFYDEEEGEYCTLEKWISPNASGAIWMASLDGSECNPYVP